MPDGLDKDEKGTKHIQAVENYGRSGKTWEIMAEYVKNTKKKRQFADKCTKSTSIIDGFDEIDKIAFSSLDEWIFWH